MREAEGARLGNQGVWGGEAGVPSLTSGRGGELSLWCPVADARLRSTPLLLQLGGVEAGSSQNSLTCQNPDLGSEQGLATKARWSQQPRQEALPRQ